MEIKLGLENMAAFYGTIDGKVSVCLTTAPDKELALQDDFKEGRYMMVTKEYAEKAIKSGLTIPLSELDLKVDRSEFIHGHYEVDLNSLDSLSSGKRFLFEQAFSNGANVNAEVKKLLQSGIDKAAVYVLNQKYVSSKAGNDYLLARPCMVKTAGNTVYLYLNSGKDMAQPKC